jgi:hypothetical protein
VPGTIRTVVRVLQIAAVPYRVIRCFVTVLCVMCCDTGRESSPVASEVRVLLSH